MRRAWLLTAIALCTGAQAEGTARIELSATAAWKGWSRPGRATELELRLGSDAKTPVRLQVLGPGGALLESRAELQAGRPLRLHLPVAAADTLAVEATADGAPAARREITLSMSESPLLGVALGADAGTRLAGFHPLALGAQDLPHQASAYAGIDALLLDDTTLAALDARQLAALLDHAGACGRIAVVNRDERVRRMLDSAAGCGGRMLVHAGDAAGAAAALESSLAQRLEPLPQAPAAEPGPGRAWQAAALLLAAYFAAALLTALFTTAWWPLLVLPVVAALVAGGWLHFMPTTAPLSIWAEGEAGESVARYQARQTLTGSTRGRASLAIAPQLAAGAMPCPSSPMPRLEFDAAQDRAIRADFETRLFGRAALCFAGGFPMKREPVQETTADGRRSVRNGGSTAWPAGWWLEGGTWSGLPALAAGAQATPVSPAAPANGAAARTALSRVPPDQAAALWQLDLAGVGDLAPGSQGWLLVRSRSR